MYQSPLNIISYTHVKKWLKKNDSENIIYGNFEKPTNCEHIVPQSYLKKYKVDKKAKKDLHILFNSNTELNSHRQNYKFDILERPYIGLDIYGKKLPDFSNESYCKKNVKKKIFDPPEESRGKIARSIGYFYWFYNIEFNNHIIDRKLLIQWNKKYKVTEEEKNRNNKIFLIQKNKNIFIDYPFLIKYIYSFPFLLVRKIMFVFQKLNVTDFFKPLPIFSFFTTFDNFTTSLGSQ